MSRCQRYVRGTEMSSDNLLFQFHRTFPLPSSWASTFSTNIFHPKHTSSSSIMMVKPNSMWCFLAQLTLLFVVVVVVVPFKDKPCTAKRKCSFQPYLNMLTLLKQQALLYCSCLIIGFSLDFPSFYDVACFRVVPSVIFQPVPLLVKQIGVSRPATQIIPERMQKNARWRKRTPVCPTCVDRAWALQTH